MQRRDSTNASSILRHIMGYTQMTSMPSAILWGREKESVARDAYVAKMRKQGHKDLHCKMTGLTLLPHHSYLGASSDGVILNHRYHRERGFWKSSVRIQLKRIPFTICH